MSRIRGILTRSSAAVTASALLLVAACGGAADSAAGSAADASPTTNSTSRSASQSPSGTPSGSASPAALSLDDADHPAGRPYWAFTAPRGWEMSVIDQQGVNQAKGPGGCRVTSYQATADGVTGSNREASRVVSQNYVEALTAKAPGAEQRNTGTMVMPGGRSFAGTPVEFVWTRVDYPSQADRMTSVIATRVFTSPDAALQLIWSCPTQRLGNQQQVLRSMQRVGSVVFE